jgi:hypothetical protein
MLALVLPHFSMLWSCSSVQESRSTDLTLLICVPIPRWIPEHLQDLSANMIWYTAAAIAYRMQMKMPKFQLAHLGSVNTCQLSCPVAVSVFRTLVPLAVCTALVAFQLDQALQRLLVLHCPVGSGRSPRHGGGCEGFGGVSCAVWRYRISQPRVNVIAPEVVEEYGCEIKLVMYMI